MLSLFFSRASRSASSSATGSANAQKCHSHTSEADQTASMHFGPSWSDIGSSSINLTASQLPQVKQLAVLTATQKLLTNRYFSISQLRNIAELIGAPTTGSAWTMLQPLHCVDYADMPPLLRESIPHLVNECLTANQRAAADVCTALNGVSL